MIVSGHFDNTILLENEMRQSVTSSAFYGVLIILCFMYAALRIIEFQDTSTNFLLTSVS